MKVIIGALVALVLFGAVPSVGLWAYKTVDSYKTQVKEYAANAEVLASNYYRARGDVANALEKNRELKSEIERLNKEYARVSAELTELQGSVSSVEELEAQMVQLASDIRAFTDEREALVPRIVHTQPQCTGSMEPTITCLDILSLVANPLPMDIEIGTVIAFNPWSLNCALIVDALVMHRVIEEKGVGKDKQFRTQGDNNTRDDGCWVPMSAIEYYLVDIEKGDNPEAMAIIEKIAALEKAQIEATVKLDADFLEIEKIKRGLMYCEPVGGRDVCPVSHVNNLSNAYNLGLIHFVQQRDTIWELRADLQVLVFGKDAVYKISRPE